MADHLRAPTCRLEHFTIEALRHGPHLQSPQNFAETIVDFFSSVAGNRSLVSLDLKPIRGGEEHVISEFIRVLPNLTLLCPPRDYSSTCQSQRR